MTELPAWLRECLGWRTDLLFAGFDGELRVCDDALVVRNARNPTWYWGNFLLLRGPPGPPSPALLARFHREFAAQPESVHVALGWSTPARSFVDAAAWEALGFEPQLGVVRVASVRDLRAALPPRVSVALREVRTDDEWARVVDNHIALRGPAYGESGYRRFAELKALQWRAMAEAGAGAWWSLWSGEALLAGCGLYYEGDVARFQQVGTAPHAQRQGLARWLVHSVARAALESGGATRVVIVAERDAVADGLYAALGFVETELQVGVQRHATPQLSARSTAAG